MRFSSRVIPNGGFAGGYLLVAVGAVALGLLGCNDMHIGRPCVTDAPADAGSASEVSIVSSPSLQCPSRICLQPALMGAVAAAAMEPAFCTAPCETDSDCSDADPATQCQKGFVCGWPTTSGPFCCQKMCICDDFVIEPKGGFPTPNSCQAPNHGGPNPATCQNVH
jgi:hypothetical protein